MISVCIATHNAGEYLLPQLKSILSQLSAGDEVVVSDDGSIDDTLEKIKSIGDARVKVVNFKQPRDYSRKRLSSFYYATANFYNALNMAAGDILFLSDQDDIWRQDKVALVSSYLNEYDIVCSNFSIIDENKNIVKLHYWENHHFDKLSLLEYWKELPFRGCCLAFKRKVLENAFPFPKQLMLHDCWIGLNAVMCGYKYKFIDEPLLLYRRHSANVSSMESPNTLLFKLAYRLNLLSQYICLRIRKTIKRTLKIK